MLDLYIDARPRGFLNGADESTLRKGVVNSTIYKTLACGIWSLIFPKQSSRRLSSLHIVPLVIASISFREMVLTLIPGDTL
jgi:hypothetical protein